MVIGFRFSPCRTFTACPSVRLQNSIIPSSIISYANSKKSWQSWIKWPTDLSWYWQYCPPRSFTSSFFSCFPFNIHALSKALCTISMGIQITPTSLSTYKSRLLSIVFIFILWWSGRGFPLTFDTFSSSNVNASALIRSWTLHFSEMQSSIKCPLLPEW